MSASNIPLPDQLPLKQAGIKSRVYHQNKGYESIVNPEKYMTDCILAFIVTSIKKAIKSFSLNCVKPSQILIVNMILANIDKSWYQQIRMLLWP